MQVDEPLWASAEMVAALGVQALQPWYADGLHTDSRDILPGDLFIALKGAETDGHRFVKKALDSGAVAAIVSQSPENVKQDDPRLIYVEDTFAALEKMAEASRARAPAKVIAVTGSAGKTSVVQALRQCLTASGLTHSSVRSFNNHVGVPLSLARMPRETRFGVFEVGMNQPGEIKARAALIKPEIAVLTTVGSAHSGAFEGDEQIADEKISLIDALQPNGVAILGMDHAYSERVLAYAQERGVKTITVSTTKPADVMPLRMTEKHNCTCLTADIGGTVMTYKVGQPGREWVLNSLLVLAAIKTAEADLGQASMALATLQLEKGRGQSIEVAVPGGSITLLDDSYNANTLSVRAALRRLSLVPQQIGAQRVAVLADMQELGDRTGELHLSLADDLQNAGVTKVYAFGQNMAALAKAASIQVEECAGPVEVVTPAIYRSLRSGDALMVKGANSAGLAALVKGFEDLGNEHTDVSELKYAASGGW